ncbi:unnamed protein product [Debaryomyces tyrocola]|nr:unnamed protein product [Debaryomyces tyrocola]
MLVDEAEESVVVVSCCALPAAASLSIVVIDAGTKNMLAPTLEHKERAKLVALATASPEHFEAKHSPIIPAQWGITQKHPVSQYGHGVLSVGISTHSLPHSGNLV